MGNFTPMSKGAARDGAEDGRAARCGRGRLQALPRWSAGVAGQRVLFLLSSLENSSRRRPLLDDVGPQTQDRLRFELANARGVYAQNLGDLVQILFFLEVQRQDGSLQARHLIDGVGQQFFQFGALQNAGREVLLIVRDIA